jgi:hypothetical protein
MVAAAPYSFNAAYALQLGDELGVPVLQQMAQRVESSGSSTTTLSNAARNLNKHVLAMCSIELLERELQQAQLQGNQQPTQQRNCCGPAPLWQLSLLAVLQGIEELPIADPYPLHLEPFLKNCMQNESFSDAVLQQLAVAVASSKRVAVDGGQLNPIFSVQFFLGPTLGSSKWQAGLDLAKAAATLLRPQLLRWTVQHPELWQHGTIDEPPLLDEFDAHTSQYQSLRLRAATGTASRKMSPLVAGLHMLQQPAAAGQPAAQEQTTTAVATSAGPEQDVLEAAGGAAAALSQPGLEQDVSAAAAALLPEVHDVAAAAAASACQQATGSLSDDVQSAVEAAMLLLQLQPASTPSLLSNWIGQSLLAYNNTSCDSHWGTSSSSSSSKRLSMHQQCIARTKAVLAAVAASPQLLGGAGKLSRKALQKLLDVGDADLAALTLMWACRLPMSSSEE